MTEAGVAVSGHGMTVKKRTNPK